MRKRKGYSLTFRWKISFSKDRQILRKSKCYSLTFRWKISFFKDRQILRQRKGCSLTFRWKIGFSKTGQILRKRKGYSLTFRWKISFSKDRQILRWRKVYSSYFALEKKVWRLCHFWRHFLVPKTVLCSNERMTSFLGDQNHSFINETQPKSRNFFGNISCWIGFML